MDAQARIAELEALVSLQDQCLANQSTLMLAERVVVAAAIAVDKEFPDQAHDPLDISPAYTAWLVASVKLERAIDKLRAVKKKLKEGGNGEGEVGD